jgi:hypothetical protein
MTYLDHSHSTDRGVVYVVISVLGRTYFETDEAATEFALKLRREGRGMAYVEIV